MTVKKRKSSVCPVCHNPVALGSKKCDHCGASIEGNVDGLGFDSNDIQNQKKSKNKIFRDFVKRWEKVEGSSEHKESQNKCPLCGVKLRLPPFKCTDCNRYYEVNDLLRAEDGMPRCPSCKSPVELCSQLDYEKGPKIEKCRECGYRFKGIEGVIGERP
ncbi:MAG: hypothetical protein JSV56_05055, partial [Methanomassiliicoccales archaeon]